MKNLISSTVILLLLTLSVSIMPTEAEAKIYDDTLRLHIIANSDSAEDQALKYEIRDLLLQKYGDRLKNSESIDEAVRSAGGLLYEMENDVQLWMQERGRDYSATITLTEEWYDTREYSDFSLPAGKYKSLRVIIGEGEGQNWWCVMYPPLCLELALENAPPDSGLINYSKEEIKLISGERYNVKFKFLEILSDAFTKNG